jgi:hypothetical protein
MWRTDTRSPSRNRQLGNPDLEWLEIVFIYSNMDADRTYINGNNPLRGFFVRESWPERAQ